MTSGRPGPREDFSPPVKFVVLAAVVINKINAVDKNCDIYTSTRINPTQTTTSVRVAYLGSTSIGHLILNHITELADQVHKKRLLTPGKIRRSRRRFRKTKIAMYTSTRINPTQTTTKTKQVTWSCCYYADQSGARLQRKPSYSKISYSEVRNVDKTPKLDPRITLGLASNLGLTWGYPELIKPGKSHSAYNCIKTRWHTSPLYYR